MQHQLSDVGKLPKTFTTFTEPITIEERRQSNEKNLDNSSHLCVLMKAGENTNEKVNFIFTIFRYLNKNIFKGIKNLKKRGTSPFISPHPETEEKNQKQYRLCDYN